MINTANNSDETIISTKMGSTAGDMTPKLHSPSRENRSAGTPSGPVPEETMQIRKTIRSKSMKDLEINLVNKTREAGLAKNRSVSFNGVSVMVDAIMNVYNSISNKKSELSNAVDTNNIHSIREFIREESVTLECALQTAVERDNCDILSDLLKDIVDVNSHLDKTGLTLLHTAAESGSAKCASLLLKHGASPNMWDYELAVTPMHSAAKSFDHTIEMLELFVNNSGDINSGLDKDGGSVLHAAIRANNVQMARYLLSQKVETIPKTFFETPLHTAAENDNYEIASLLLESNPGCINSLKNKKERQTPLHIVADAGYSNTCEVLLNFGADVSLVNGQCMTPVHLAARNPNEPVLRKLLERGADLNTKLVNTVDGDGRTPLFVCTSSKGRGATECMLTLVEFGAELDIQTDDGYTALHMAAIDRKPSRVNVLISQGADLSIKNKAGFSSLYFINKKVPQCMKTFEERLDTGLRLESANSEMSSKVKMDFNKLSPNMNSLHRQDIAIFMELMKSPYHVLLKHPLSQAFLYLKWNQIKYLHLIFIIFSHFIYSTVYTIYALLIFGSICEPHDYDSLMNDRFNLSISIPCYLKGEGVNPSEVWIARVAWLFLILFTFIYVVNEGIKILTTTKSYFRKWDSYIDLVLILSFFLISFHGDPFKDKVFIGLWQFHVAAVGCFLTWLQMMFYIGKLPRFGKYVQMFRAVATGVLHFMIAYSPLIIAFAVSFMIMFPNNDAFSQFPYAIIKLFVMMLGEIDYEDLYYPQKQFLNFTEIVSESENQAFPGTAHLLVLLFIFLVSIILMNLLVGLAVSDIQGLSKSAKLNQLVQQVELINYMEGWLFSPIFGWSPDNVKKFLRSKLQGLEGQNYNMVYTVKPFDTNNRVLPESLKRSLYDNCIRRESKVKEFNRDAALIEMQTKIQQIFVLLGGKPNQSTNNLSSQLSRSRLSIFSNISSQLQVEDDYESDNDGNIGVERNSTLCSITEEAEPIRQPVRRKLSNISNISSASTDVESDGGTVSDYVTLTDDRFESIP